MYKLVKTLGYDDQLVVVRREKADLDMLCEACKAVVLASDAKAGSLATYQVLREGKLCQIYDYVVKAEAEIREFKIAARKIALALKGKKAQSCNLVFAGEFTEAEQVQVLRGLYLESKSYDDFKTTGLDNCKKERPEPKLLEEVKVFSSNLSEAGLATAKNRAETVELARYLVNSPANVIYPETLAQKAREAAKKYGFEIEVFDEKQIQEMNLAAFYSVAKGSDLPPRFIVMKYHNNPEDERVLALVGKGLTYDSGGYAIKPATGMYTMFCDMGGSASVIGAISLLAAQKAKVNVTAIVATCENMVSGRAFRNGDIIPSLSGKFIEIINTDAEGRLTLADAVNYAASVEKVSHIIDVATLTGAVIVALGANITGVVSDSEDLYSALEAASKTSSDKVWRLPCDDEIAESNKSERADIKNSGGRMAGTVSAGLFVRAFAEGKPWLHLDIAATAYRDSANSYEPKGATGVGVELLYETALELFKK